jgi:LPS sulfotransferase NodH
MMARGYVICSSQRCGSNYFCQLLTSTGKLGRPQDWFNGPGIRAREDANYPLEHAAQLKEVLARGKSPNGIYGLKMFCNRFDETSDIDWVGELPALRWVYLERRDLLGQAISDVRSAQTQQYRSTAEPKAAPRFDRAAIRETLVRLACEQARWKVYFARNALAPVHLVYEDIVADPQRAVDAVATLMDVHEPCTVAPGEVTLQVQRDTLSDEWRERFLSLDGDMSRLDRVTPLTENWRRKARDLWHSIAH